jgi:hypothetical protein
MVPAVSPSSGAELFQRRPYGQLPREVQQEIDRLAKRDREVRTHERAHITAAGAHAVGGPEYQYELGPDGRRYAVSGEVPIDMSEVPGNPEATAQKMERVRRAALAPSHPSPQDRQVAAQAARIAARARMEIADQEAADQAAGAEQTGGARAVAHSGTEPCQGCAIGRYGETAKASQPQASGVTA